MSKAQWLAAVSSVLCATVTAAERFENIYLSFNLPDGWKCKQEETEFVCTPPSPTGKNYPAMMIMAAKLAGPDDTLAAYKLHLGQIPPATGRGTIVKSPIQTDIQGVLWIDATLLGSEVENYYTRYMATVKGDVAVLFTFSVHKSRYEDFAGAYTLVTQTLKIKQDAMKQGRR
ncbi:hypothetical protein [Azohydromonas aeria]|uniref:hypothetical protein n=1 Tax=Azohydromonas aeria TaxID=2590212 RepID=UPI0012F8A3CC|nr:hypothetical protein [Azohydromonas aeria]